MAEVGRPTSAQTLHTEFAFVLPRGYVDETGAIHREGVMRLATARDEILPLLVDQRGRRGTAATGG